MYACFTENEIDGDTLLNMTERMIEKLFPTIKQQVSFMKHVSLLKQGNATVTGMSSTVSASPNEHSSLMR